MNIAIAITVVAFIGTFIISVFDTKLAILMNGAMIGLLPDSFEPLRFVNSDLNIIQKGQLTFSNLSLLPLAILYPTSYLAVIGTSNGRSVKKTTLLLISVYVVYFIAGLAVSLFYV